MNAIRQKNLSAWYASPRGQVFARKLQEAVAPWLQGIFGYHAVQLGMCPALSLLEQSRINHRVMADYPDCGDVLCRPEALPFESDSIDLLVAAHCLEVSDDPHALLREAERALVAEGHLLVIGIDPWTLWGGWRKLSGRGSQLYSQSKVKDWLGLLGFDFQRSQMLPMFDVHLPLGMASLPKTGQFANLLASNIAGGYAMLAKKRVTTLTPITPPWRRAPKLIPGGLVKPAARSQRRTPAPAPVLVYDVSRRKPKPE
ncbi:MAG TPA: methyltransferase domain-containing protein [Gammaproteobacteria bacterium]|nr:methyltransferase domain-containing protein [Gammaproteobacteria bacterium]